MASKRIDLGGSFLDVEEDAGDERRRQERSRRLDGERKDLFARELEELLGGQDEPDWENVDERLSRIIPKGTGVNQVDEALENRLARSARGAIESNLRTKMQRVAEREARASGQPLLGDE